ncbi:MAG: flagellar hook-basal body protein [Pseudomonas sp.]|uniref:flagellar hook-basal body protein n=1 Tax=Stenotrophomonas sp. TaxID=69392 RepID=UPI003D6CCC6E
MNGVFYIGATGLNAQQTAVDITANNVSNINTAGYKRGVVSFSELVGATSPNERSSPSSNANGVMATPALHVFTQGDLRPTGNALDLAIRGDGFIELQARSGDSVLWRGGTLHIGEDGYLTAPNGLPLHAMITVPSDATSLTIRADGQVLAALPDQSELLELGNIELVRAKDSGRLLSLGDGMYGIAEDDLTLSRGVPGEDNAGLIAQGFSEASNVQLSDELVNLMIYQRAYAANARLVQIGDELMGIANGLKR